MIADVYLVEWGEVDRRLLFRRVGVDHQLLFERVGGLIGDFNLEEWMLIDVPSDKQIGAFS